MEPRADLVNAIMELARHGGTLTVEEITAQESKDLTLDGLLLYEHMAHEMMGAARVIRETFRREIAERLGDGAVRYGDYIYRNGRETKWRLLDPDGLANWLGEDWKKVVRVSADNLRRTALRSVAEARGYSPESIVDTFIEVSYSDRELRVMPLERAPKFLQDMEEGEVRAPKAPESGDGRPS